MDHYFLTRILVLIILKSFITVTNSSTCDPDHFSTDTTNSKFIKGGCACPTMEQANAIDDLNKYFKNIKNTLNERRKELEIFDDTIVPRFKTKVNQTNWAHSLNENCYDASNISKKDDVFKFELKNFQNTPFFAQCYNNKEVFSEISFLNCDIYGGVTKNFGDGWMVALRRTDGNLNFNRSWLDYKNGFGSPNGEFFIGLEKLHRLTHNEIHELLIIMSGKDELQIEHAHYESFIVENERYRYRLSALGRYSGDALDRFRNESGCNFSTFDRDSDGSKLNCALMMSGGWWFKDCGDVHLTGLYHDGLIWYNKTRTMAEMLIRPAREPYTSAFPRIHTKFQRNDEDEVSGYAGINGYDGGENI